MKRTSKMKCEYFEKECDKGCHSCISCMRDEINHYKKKAEGNTISITKDKLAMAQSKALTALVVDNPVFMLFSDEMYVFAALTAKLLFNEEEKS